LQNRLNTLFILLWLDYPDLKGALKMTWQLAEAKNKFSELVRMALSVL